MSYLGIEKSLPQSTVFWFLFSKYDAVFTQSNQPFVAGRWGIPRVIALLQRQFVMHRVRHFVFLHVCTCASCLLVKVERTKARGLLQPLTIPSRK